MERLRSLITWNEALLAFIWAVFLMTLETQWRFGDRAQTFWAATVLVGMVIALLRKYVPGFRSSNYAVSGTLWLVYVLAMLLGIGLLS